MSLNAQYWIFLNLWINTLILFYKSFDIYGLQKYNKIKYIYI
jgi:hypothetical protein